MQNVCPGSVVGCVYVRLEDSANKFDQVLVDNINAMILDLKQKVINNNIVTNGSENKAQDEESEEEDAIDETILSADEVYIRQIDYT